jgi:pyruvate/2-oxoglutarate dehydrogenase complex dihydrolipoamide dehydrogenase (E3) component
MVMKKYDAPIIGSGQGGTPLAKKLAGAGYKTALVERRWVGGTCVNDGCTPTKAMVASAKTAHSVKSSAALGVTVDRYHIHIGQIISRQQDMVSSFRDGSEKRLVSTDKLDLIYGEASFTGHKKALVKKNSGDSEEISSDLIFIDTGTIPSVPPIDGLETVPYLTSTSILQLRELPEHLLIIGGGYVGMEFGQMYRRFGSRVTMIVRSDRLSAKEDQDISTEIHKLFREEEIDIRLNAETLKINKDSGSIKVVIKADNKNETISCSHILIATGRRPDTEILNLPATGVNTNEKGFIKVDEKLQTGVNGIYALGDVNGGPAFTHISYHDHLIIFNNLVHGRNETTDGRPVPYCMYIDPQLGRVGITEQEARAKGLNVQIAKLPMTSVARAIETGDTRGFMKAVVDKGNKKILGAAILGAEGGEIMSIVEVAMMGGLTYDKIRDAIFAHPSYAESLNNLFGALSD